MDDNLKAALKALRGAAGGSLDRGVVDAILAHIDGEPERIAAARTEAADRAWDEAVKATELEQAHVRLRAVAAAREEQREACAQYAEPSDEEACAVIRTTPLDATPLADRIAETERALADAVAIAREFDARQQKAEARVAELEAQAETDDARAVEVNDAHLKQVATLRARVAELEAGLVSIEQTAARVADRSLEVFELRHEFRLVRLTARAILAKYPEGK